LLVIGEFSHSITMPQAASHLSLFDLCPSQFLFLLRLELQLACVLGTGINSGWSSARNNGASDCASWASGANRAIFKVVKMNCRIVGYICDIEGRHPATAKIIKILEWPVPSDLREARSFIGIVVYKYYRIWIPGFAVIARPIYILFRKGESFYWGNSQQEAMDKLKIAITSAPALISIDYSKNGGDFIVSTDASGEVWGAVLAVLRALKKFRSYLYGVRFVLETDAKTLVAQLNRSATDLPGSLVVRWISWIRLFDFTVKHVPGTKNSATDALSRRPATENELHEAEREDFDAFLDQLRRCIMSLREKTKGLYLILMKMNSEQKNL
jgi:reverse transcriptase-like protein